MSHVDNLLGDVQRGLENLFHSVSLNQFQYAHVKDHATGRIMLYEGPKRFRLTWHEELVGIFDKIRVLSRQFVVVLNPYDFNQQGILEGEREVRVGPLHFSLHPGETLEDGVKDEYVITDDEALTLFALREVPHPTDPDRRIPAGTEVVLQGPRRYVPDRYVRVQGRRASVSLSSAQGAYIQNNDTGEVRLLIGPSDFFVADNESLWDKHLTGHEQQALGYVSQIDDTPKDQSRVLSALPRRREHLWEAAVVELEDNEAIYLYEGDKIRVEFGPKRVFLEPNERPKVLFISGGVPVRPNVLRIAKLSLGPDFIRDRLIVRTRDNATLNVDVTYHWRFRVNTEETQKLFALKDFVGFVAQTLSGEIREEAAKHDFEAFHSNATQVVKQAIFGEAGSRFFTENDLEVFRVDVERVTPDDPEIARKLTDAIKANVDIYTRRVQEEAQLESERRLVTGKVATEEAKRALIEIQLANERLERLEKTNLQEEIRGTQARGQAKALTITAQAERDAEEKRLQAISAILASDGGKAYIQLEQARVLQPTDKVVVPTDARIHLGFPSAIDED